MAVSAVAGYTATPKLAVILPMAVTMPRPTSSRSPSARTTAVAASVAGSMPISWSPPRCATCSTLSPTQTAKALSTASPSIGPRHSFTIRKLSSPATTTLSWVPRCEASSQVRSTCSRIGAREGRAYPLSFSIWGRLIVPISAETPMPSISSPPLRDFEDRRAAAMLRSLPKLSRKLRMPPLSRRYRSGGGVGVKGRALAGAQPAPPQPSDEQLPLGVLAKRRLPSSPDPRAVLFAGDLLDQGGHAPAGRGGVRDAGGGQDRAQGTEGAAHPGLACRS